MKGTSIRLRPVLITATMASLGFLPMAFGTLSSFGQEIRHVSLSEALAETKQNNNLSRIAVLSVERQRKLNQAALEVGKTNFMYLRGQYNSYKDDRNITITQSIPFPTVFGTQAALSKSLIRSKELEKLVTENELAYEVKKIFYNLIYLHERESLWLHQDSLYEKFVRANDAKQKQEEKKILDKMWAETQLNESHNYLLQTQADIRINQDLLTRLMNTDQSVDVIPLPLEEYQSRITLQGPLPDDNPLIAVARQNRIVAGDERKVSQAKAMPDIHIGYFNQTLIGTPTSDAGGYSRLSNRYHGFQFGLAIPLWFGPQAAKIKAAAIMEEEAELELNQTKLESASAWQQAGLTYWKLKNNLNFYKNAALPQAEELFRQSQKAFDAGNIDYRSYWDALSNLTQVRDHYLLSISEVNRAVIDLEYLAGVE